MNQSFDTLLQVVQRALGEVVLPAVSGADKHVVEQLHLSMAALGLMQARLASARAFSRREVDDYIDIARAIGSAAGSDVEGVAALLDAAEDAGAQLSRPAADTADYVATSRRLREIVGGFVEASAGEHYEERVDALVLAFGQKIQLRARRWCAPLGFELSPDDLGPRDW